MAVVSADDGGESRGGGEHQSGDRLVQQRRHRHRGRDCEQHLSIRGVYGRADRYNRAAEFDDEWAPKCYRKFHEYVRGALVQRGGKLEQSETNHD